MGLFEILLADPRPQNVMADIKKQNKFVQELDLDRKTK